MHDLSLLSHFLSNHIETSFEEDLTAHSCGDPVPDQHYHEKKPTYTLHLVYPPSPASPATLTNNILFPKSSQESLDEEQQV